MTTDALESIVQRALNRRSAPHAEEVRRLLDAGLAVMVRCGTDSTPRVADIVAAAGLSNDAFYRYFPSKVALVEALVEVGASQVRSYTAHLMAKETDPARQVRRWVDGVLRHAEEDVATTTRAILWNASNSDSGGEPPGRQFGSGPLAALLHDPFTKLGSGDPQLHALLVAHAVLGILTDHLWARTTPSAQERERITAFALAGARAS